MAVPAWFNGDEYFANKAAQTGLSQAALKAAFNAAGYDTTADGLYQHFLDYGNAEGVSPNALFNAEEYIYAKAQEFFKVAVPGLTQISEIEVILRDNGLTAWDHYQQYGWLEDVNPSNGFDQSAYLDAKLAQMQLTDPGYTLAQLTSALDNVGLSALDHWYAYGQNENLGWSPSGATPTDAVTTHYLTSDMDNLTGTAGKDKFWAYQGTLNDGDRIDGGAGEDELYAYVDDANNATTVTATNVEKISLRAQHENRSGDLGNNNPAGRVHFDAGDVGENQMTYLRSDNSRAALVVEDVRTNSNIMTVGFTDADSGRGVDFEVYFDSQHLKGGDTTSTLLLRIMDAKGAQEAGQPLRDIEPTGLRFTYQATAGGSSQTVELTFRAEDRDLYTGVNATYATLVTAFEHAIEDAGYTGVFTVNLGQSFTGTGGIGTIYTSNIGQIIELSATTGTITPIAWLIPAIPPDAAFVTSIGTSTECPLIRTDIDLDNVGRVQWSDASPDCLPDESLWGSESGDMIVGSMATRGGIERFDVKVDRGSWLSSLSSTNNTLRMVTVTAKDINGDNYAGNIQGHANDTMTGQLYIGKSLAAGSDNLTDWTSGSTLNLKQQVSWTDMDVLLSTDGLTDVKVFDAAGYAGNINIGAQLTSVIYDKYLNDVSGQWSKANADAPRGNFEYVLGNNGDALNMVVDGVAAHQDFRLNIDASEGSDFVNFSFADHMTVTQNNNIREGLLNAGHERVVISGGVGNDTIKSWGNGAVVANGGEGNDVIFVAQLANTHTDHDAVSAIGANAHNAVWVLNTTPAANALTAASTKMIYWDDVTGAQHLNNDAYGGPAVFSNNGAAATAAGVLNVTVSFHGVTATVKVADLTTAGIASVTAELVNQKIAEAVANSPVLQHVLVVKDGAGHALLVESLINGLELFGNLIIDFNAVDGAGNAIANDLVTALEQAYDPTTASTTTRAADFATEPLPDGVATIATYGSDITRAEVMLHNLATKDQGDIFTITINGEQYTGDVAGLAAANPTDTDLIDYLMAPTTTDSQGHRLSDKYFIRDDADANEGVIFVTQLNAGKVDSFEVSLYKLTPTNLANNWVDGHNTEVGCASNNFVEGGAGDDVIVLNADSLANTLNFDILVLSGTTIGNDTVFNFDGGGTKGPLVSTTMDKIDLRAYATGTNVVGISTSATGAGATLLDEIADGLTTDGSWNGATGVALIRDSGSLELYHLVGVAASGTVDASEVTLYGSVRLVGLAGALGDNDVITADNQLSL